MDSDQQKILELIAENAANKAVQSIAEQSKKDLKDALKQAEKFTEAKLPKLVGDLVDKICTRWEQSLRKDIGNALGTNLDKQDQVAQLQVNLHLLDKMVKDRDRNIMTIKQVLINWLVKAIIVLLLMGFGVVLSQMVVLESNNSDRAIFNLNLNKGGR